MSASVSPFSARSIRGLQVGSWCAQPPVQRLPVTLAAILIGSLKVLRPPGAWRRFGARASDGTCCSSKSARQLRTGAQPKLVARATRVNANPLTRLLMDAPARVQWTIVGQEHICPPAAGISTPYARHRNGPMHLCRSELRGGTAGAARAGCKGGVTHLADRCDVFGRLPCMKREPTTAYTTA